MAPGPCPRGPCAAWLMLDVPTSLPALCPRGIESISLSSKYTFGDMAPSPGFDQKAPIHIPIIAQDACRSGTMLVARHDRLAPTWDLVNIVVLLNALDRLASPPSGPVSSRPFPRVLFFGMRCCVHEPPCSPWPLRQATHLLASLEAGHLHRA